MRYTLTDELPREIGREFNSRTRFAIVNNPAEADAVLNGTINSAVAIPTIYDPSSGKATSVQVVVNLTVKLLEQRTGKSLVLACELGNSGRLRTRSRSAPVLQRKWSRTRPIES